MLCSKCSAELNRGAQFCWRCGAPAGPATPAGGAAPAQRAIPWMAIAAGILVLLGAAALLVARLGFLGGRPLTTEAAGGFGADQRVIATPPGSFPTAPGLPQTNPPDREAGAEDIAAYLRKLEAIQRRDSANPMAQLFAMMATGLSGLGQIGRELGEDENIPSQQPTDYLRTFDTLMREKHSLVTDFRAITPVPQACQHLHALYGRYLQTQAQAIAGLRSAIAQANNPAAPLAALPAGKSAESAQAAARIEEDAIRQRYHIPRAMDPLVP